MTTSPIGPQHSKEAVGLRLKAIRLALGFDKTRAFAESFGASSQQISNYEKGQNYPAVLEMVRLIRRHGGVTLDLIYDENYSCVPYDLAVKIKSAHARLIYESTTDG